MEYKGDKGHDNKSCPPLDHSKSLNDFKPMGIPILAPYLGDSCKSVNMGEFTVKPFDLTTIDGSWTHTNADGTPCPIYGFLITHKEMGRMLYITDCELIKWKFRDIKHILLGVNYDKDLIDRDNTGKANHVFRGHLSIDTACDFVKANYSEYIKTEEKVDLASFKKACSVVDGKLITEDGEVVPGYTVEESQVLYTK